MEGRIQRKMILWTLLLVLGLAIISFLFMIQPPDDLVAVSLSSQARSLTKSSRQPASVSKQIELGLIQPVSTQISNAIEMTLKCDPKATDSIAGSVRQVRLRGQPCLANTKQSKLDRVEIKNLTNKMEASVFFLPSQEYTTDYIALLEGENRFEIAEKYSDGSISRHELILFRQSP